MNVALADKGALRGDEIPERRSGVGGGGRRSTIENRRQARIFFIKY